MAIERHIHLAMAMEKRVPKHFPISQSNAPTLDVSNCAIRATDHAIRLAGESKLCELIKSVKIVKP